MICEVSDATEIEPVLQTLIGETFNFRTTTRDDDARLDIYAHEFWGLSENALFDVWVMSPNASSHCHLAQSACYQRAEKEKDQKYGKDIRRVMHASFTPFVFATTGGVGKLTAVFL